jgi:hypothetical protein
MTDLTITASNVVVADPKPRVLYGSCGETITAGLAVYLAAATKKWMRADSNSPEAEVRQAIGIAMNGGSLNQPIQVLQRGRITIGATLVPGSAYYLSNNPGGICLASDMVAGDYICHLGLASSTSVLDVAIQFPNVVTGGIVAPPVRNLQGAQTFGDLGQVATATSGGITWVGPTWSLTDHDSRIDISGSNNQTATHNVLGSSPHPSAKSEESQTTGQRYVEFHIDLVSGGELVSVGIGNGAAPISGLAAGMDTSSNSVGYSSAGNVWYNGGFASINGDVNLPSFTTGDVIGMLIDLDTNTLKFRKNGGTYSATMSITAMRPSSDPIFVICTLDAISSITSNGVTLINI